MIPQVSTQAPGYGEICTGVAVFSLHSKMEQLLALCIRASRGLWMLPLHHPLLKMPLVQTTGAWAPLNSPTLGEGPVLRLGMESTSPHYSVWYCHHILTQGVERLLEIFPALL